MIGLMLLAIAFCLDAIRDRWYEVYKLNVIQYGQEPPINKNWWSYNPLSKGIFRDGWHTLKWIQHSCIVVIITIYLPFAPHWYCRLATALLIWAVFFNLSLAIARRRVTAANNLR